MKKILYTLAVLSMVGCGSANQASTSGSPVGTRAAAPAQVAQQRYVIGFYNLENLFDTYHDEGKNDYEYLPDGANQWTEAKYAKKLTNMASVIKAMHDENNAWHTILGVSEIENRHVLEDLVAQPEIAEANYQIIHYDGPDSRGVDVALFYRPEFFQVLESRSIPFDFNSDLDFGMTQEEKDAFRTRDILMVRGMLGGEMFAFFVAHLPSRLGDKSSALRSRGGQIMYQVSQELMRQYPGIKIAAMGDMNDNPTDDSMAIYMHGKEKLEDVGPADFFSPFLSMLKAGYSSLYYRGGGNIYDIIVVNSALAKAPQGGLKIQPIVNQRYYGRVFSQPFMTQQDGQYAGQPFRTFSNGAFVGGYSDHYPTYIIVSNK